MIIQRIAKGIRDQDWFVVTIEIMIVVVGIFIGLQVTEWNEGRKERAAIISTYQDLIRDFDAIHEHADTAVIYHRDVTNSLREMLRYIRGEDDTNNSVVLEALARGDTSYTSSSPSKTYRSLVATGKMQHISSKALRDALTEYDRAINSPSFSDIRLVMTEYEVSFKKYTQIDLDFKLTGYSQDNSFSDVGLSGFDMEAMKNDPEFINAAEQMLRMQYYYHLNHQASLAFVKVIRSLLEPYREKSQ